MAQSILLAGNGISAKVLVSYLRRDSRYNVVAATVDDAFVADGRFNGLTVHAVSGVVRAVAQPDCRVVMGVGYSDLNRTRESLMTRLKGLGYAIETYVHPEAQVHTTNLIGEGAVILPGAVVEPGVVVGANAVVWANTTLAHDCILEDHCWIASGAVISGQARVGRNSFVGVNATIVNDVVVGEYNIIGAGAIVTKSTKPGTVHLARSAEPVRFGAQDYAKHFRF